MTHPIVGRAVALGSFALVLALGAVPPRRADACTFVPVVRPGEPAAGAVDVPTNVVPWIRGRIRQTATVTLVDAAGTAVPADVTRSATAASGQTQSFVEIAPRAPLAQRARYAIVVADTNADGSAAPESPTRIEFTTGDGPLAAAVSALDDVVVQVGDRGDARSSCGDNTLVCAGAAGGGTLEVAVQNAAGVIEGRGLYTELPSMRDPTYFDRTPLLRDGRFCVRVRRRDLAGRYSAPVVRCSDEVPSFAGAVTDSASCDRGRLRRGETYVDVLPRGGCACAAPSADGRGVFAVGAAAVALAVVRRARRRAKR